MKTITIATILVAFTFVLCVTSKPARQRVLSNAQLAKLEKALGRKPTGVFFYDTTDKQQVGAGSSDDSLKKRDDSDDNPWGILFFKKDDIMRKSAGTQPWSFTFFKKNDQKRDMTMKRELDPPYPGILFFKKEDQ